MSCADVKWMIFLYFMLVALHYCCSLYLWDKFVSLKNEQDFA